MVDLRFTAEEARRLTMEHNNLDKSGVYALNSIYEDIRRSCSLGVFCLNFSDDFPSRKTVELVAEHLKKSGFNVHYVVAEPFDNSVISAHFYITWAF